MQYCVSTPQQAASCSVSQAQNNTACLPFQSSGHQHKRGWPCQRFSDAIYAQTSTSQAASARFLDGHTARGQEGDGLQAGY